MDALRMLAATSRENAARLPVAPVRRVGRSSPVTTDPASLAATASILRRLSGSIAAMSESIAAASDANHQLPVSARRAARDLGAAGAGGSSPLWRSR